VTAFSGNWIQRRAARRKAVSAIYRGLVHHALAPTYYADAGVPDTFEGRAGMVTALTSLACARLGRISGPEAARMIQRLNATVLDGFDAAFREKGVGDHSIARKVRTLAEAHSGLGRALFEAFSAPETGDLEARLAEILRRNGLSLPDKAAELAGALVNLQDRFTRQSDTEILHGQFDWIGAGSGANTPER
jgi:cytochrome b pre-mRNA-processing protein 3